MYTLLLIPLFLSTLSKCQRLILTNDDGWATAQIRAQYEALQSAGYDVILSAPALDQSGTGTNRETPTVLTEPCEFDTCPVGSPATGFNASDTHLNYVNAFPADAASFGIQTLAPQLFNGAVPDFVVSGPNIGSNLGPIISGSGTVGAASEAALEGIPSAAFSAFSGSQVSYTTLESDPTSDNTINARLYAALTAKFVNILHSTGPAPILPANVSLNVNFPLTAGCSDVDDYRFVLTRINPFTLREDVETCGSTHLPWEDFVIATFGQCFASVSVFDATNQEDASVDEQAFVLNRIGDFLTCYSV